MMEALGLARATIRQAMASLESEGLIRRVQGKGTFVEQDVRRKLKRGQDIFALVVPETREGFYPSLLHGFEIAASGIDYQTIVSNTDNDIERQGNIVLQLLDKEVGGVAINTSDVRPTPAFQIRQLQKQGIPVVFCHRGVDGVAAPLLAIPFEECGRLEGRALAEYGHRHVAFFTTKGSQASVISEAALREALQVGIGDCRVESVYIEDRPISLREETCWAALQELFAKPNPPTAIVATFDSLAELIYYQLQKLGLRVPQDVSLIGEGGTWREDPFSRRLTSVVIDETATGQKAVELLHEMRCGDRAIDSDEVFVMQPELYRGETLAAPTSTSRRG
jgi:DNA-binding LacI/PurR family transcriptional regulator